MSQDPPRTLHDRISFGERKVTIYVGVKKHEAKQVTVSIGPMPPYAKRFFVSFKPKGARSRQLLGDRAEGHTVILDGWGHPEFDSLIHGFRDAPTQRLSPISTFQIVSVTFRADGNNPKDKYELEFGQYLKELDPAKILFNNREKPATA